ncbi:hypothetical protein WDW89_03870 [Deltaproteobacteria bacterium TL4]
MKRSDRKQFEPETHDENELSIQDRLDREKLDKMELAYLMNHEFFEYELARIEAELVQNSKKTGSYSR